MVFGGLEVELANRHHAGRTTPYVLLAAIIAACGGLMFGYDIGISGGVTSMDDFQKKFFPVVYENKHEAKNNYCAYNNQGLQAFTSSLYLMGMITSLCSSVTSRKYGRKASILTGGISFLCGAVVNAAAINLVMLIIGRMLLGAGIGFACQAVPLYLSEIAPTHLRGALNIMFQLIITFGIFCANLINYGTGKLQPWGWRLSLGIAILPGIIVTVGSLFLPESPNSLVERGFTQRGKDVLVRIRGTRYVEAEFSEILHACRLANEVEQPFKKLFQKKYIPPLTMGTMIAFLNQMTGINAIMFYAPALFVTIGFGNSAALYSAVIIGAVNMMSTLVAVIVVDRFGRKILFYQSGVQMLVSLTAIGFILKYDLGLHGQLSKSMGILVVVLICVFISAFAWSWGPLLWLVPSEIFPMQVRPAGQSVAVAVNLFFTFGIGQSLLTLLCVLEYGIFLFFAAWVLFMSIFVALLLPETKNVPIEQVTELWEKHWFWKRIVGSD